MHWHHLEDTLPIARKKHICHLCGKYIDIGTQHVSRSGIVEDGIMRIHMHIECEKHTKEYDNDDWEHHDQHEFFKSLTPKSLFYKLFNSYYFPTSVWKQV